MTEIEALSFEGWFDKTMVNSVNNGADIATQAFYVSCMSHIRAHRCRMIAIATQNTGLFKADSDEFKDAQKEWFANFNQVLILRQCMIMYYHFPCPPWKELQPEREYFGTFLSEEDYMKFMTEKGKFKLLKAETIQERQKREDQELEENREEERKDYEKNMKELKLKKQVSFTSPEEP